mmetsp:Transcript_11167/g.34462  ORF Transcript_11167/g.34462 Transcript_11167/m.34462 type:complete len:177 (-) Transcript_11167:27-557(-)
MKNRKVTRKIPYEATLGGRRVPFAFATEAWLAPMCVRADAFAELGGFDETLALPGEPGIGLDIHLSLRAGIRGLTVGVHGAEFERGVGGHGTVSDERKTQLRLRKRAEISTRIREVAGCRWPPEMLRRADDLNKAHLVDRAAGAEARHLIDAHCRKFAKHACPPKKPPPRRSLSGD